MNWISTKDKLPSSKEEIVLAYTNNEIYMGSFYAYESYNLGADGSKINYVKTINFVPIIWLNKNHCDNCQLNRGCDGQCTDCCDKDLEISLSISAYNLDKVTHWMPLPEIPKT